jgi:hypothetical protein
VISRVAGPTTSVEAIGTKESEKTISYDATVVNFVPGSKADLKPATEIFGPRWEKKADGSWEAGLWSWAGKGSPHPVPWRPKASTSDDRSVGSAFGRFLRGRCFRLVVRVSQNEG